MAEGESVRYPQAFIEDASSQKGDVVVGLGYWAAAKVVLFGEENVLRDIFFSLSASTLSKSSSLVFQITERDISHASLYGNADFERRASSNIFKVGDVPCGFVAGSINFPELRIFAGNPRALPGLKSLPRDFVGVLGSDDSAPRQVVLPNHDCTSGCCDRDQDPLTEGTTIPKWFALLLFLTVFLAGNVSGYIGMNFLHNGQIIRGSLHVLAGIMSILFCVWVLAVWIVGLP